MREFDEVFQEIFDLLGPKAQFGHTFASASFTLSKGTRKGRAIFYVNEQEFANVDVKRNFENPGDFGIGGRWVKIFQPLDTTLDVCWIALTDTTLQANRLEYGLSYGKQADASEDAADIIAQHLIEGVYPSSPTKLMQ